ncbi:carbon starvation protein CstA [Mammaliicoccus lentus]|uniref:Carbon starvation CstA family protein n=1 Tax=Mammaliicoccus lentus TaxID=42858 RepID=A0AAX3W2H7_MAMLE|nr:MULTISPECIES: carbon starvation CstA family protein [Mammaliicoccus]HBV04731.1 carbon starvation protein A [Staphylococcus sp.]MBW0762364.1 carbon starvation protein A [Mammaliicoccus lentus]MBW0768693.1 carbon starvation protein A [Mammaliicoccus lentus]MBW0769563.1 carbon starvation protein A [Mammaliicoccus lentus]MCR1872477.1 carbon starvation protein A [Mammaliicoccus lentus]
MITFISSIIILILGYVFYGKYIERVFEIYPDKETPAYSKQDNMDFVPMPAWKGWMIQLLNIAGLGPIFGAVSGALYGPVAFIWIVVGCIIAGGVHDYFSGMLSLRHGGAQFPKLVQHYLGKFIRVFTDIVSVVLMVLVAAAFVAGPAQLLSSKTPISFLVALIIIFAYFILAAILPINKIIGRIYPIFGVILIVMAVSVAVALIFSGKPIPEITVQNLHPSGIPVWPLLMVTISCGAISGFHCTQSPIISRTVKNESEGRKVFYGAMISEGIIALIWAAAGMTFFGGTKGLASQLQSIGPAGVVDQISIQLLGPVGGVLALLGVIILPITTGDTALRSSRMIIEDFVKDKVSINSKALMIAASFAVGIPAFFLSTIDYSFLWRYVGFTNQIVATVMLWVSVSYLLRYNKAHLVAGIPALFMTGAVSVYVLYAPEGLSLPYNTALIGGAVVFIIVSILYVRAILKQTEPITSPTQDLYTS